MERPQIRARGAVGARHAAPLHLGLFGGQEYRPLGLALAQVFDLLKTRPQQEAGGNLATITTGTLRHNQAIFRQTIQKARGMAEHHMMRALDMAGLVFAFATYIQHH